jgi:hypothetical protein
MPVTLSGRFSASSISNLTLSAFDFMTITFSPKLSNCSTIDLRAPSPIPVSEITAATPMDMPKTVKNVLSRFDVMPSNAINAENFNLTSRFEIFSLFCIIITP